MAERSRGEALTNVEKALSLETIEGVLRTAELMQEQLAKRPNDEAYAEWVEANHFLLKRLKDDIEKQHIGIKRNDDLGLPSIQEVAVYFEKTKPLLNKNDAQTEKLLSEIEKTEKKLESLEKKGKKTSESSRQIIEVTRDADVNEVLKMLKNDTEDLGSDTEKWEERPNTLAEWKQLNLILLKKINEGVTGQVELPNEDLVDYLTDARIRLKELNVPENEMIDFENKIDEVFALIAGERRRISDQGLTAREAGVTPANEEETELTETDMEDVTPVVPPKRVLPPPPPPQARRVTPPPPLSKALRRPPEEPTPVSPKQHDFDLPIQPPVERTHEITKTRINIKEELQTTKQLLQNATERNQWLIGEMGKVQKNSNKYMELLGTFRANNKRIAELEERENEMAKISNKERLRMVEQLLRLAGDKKEWFVREMVNSQKDSTAYKELLAQSKANQKRILELEERESDLKRKTSLLGSLRDSKILRAGVAGMTPIALGQIGGPHLPGSHDFGGSYMQSPDEFTPPAPSISPELSGSTERVENFTEEEVGESSIEKPTSPTPAKTPTLEAVQQTEPRYDNAHTITLGAGDGFYRAVDQIAGKIGRGELVKRLSKAKPDWFVKFKDRTEHWRTPAQKKKDAYSDAQKESIERLWKIYELVDQENYFILPGAQVGYEIDKYGVPHAKIISQGMADTKKTKTETQKTKTGELEEMLRDVESAPSEAKTAIQDNVLQHAIDMGYVEVNKKTGQLSLEGKAKRSPIFKEIAALVANYDRDLKEGTRTPAFGNKGEKAGMETKPQKQIIDTEKIGKLPTLGQQKAELTDLLSQINPRNIGERNFQTKAIEFENVPGVGWVPKTAADFRQLNQLYQDGDEIAIKIYGAVNKFNSTMPKKTDQTPWYMQTAAQAKKENTEIAGASKEPDWKELAALHKVQTDVDAETFITRRFPDPKIKQFMDLRGNLLERGQVTIRSLWGLTSKKTDIGRYLPNLPMSPDLDKSKLAKIFLETRKGVEKLRHELARGDSQTETALVALDQLLGELGNKYK